METILTDLSVEKLVSANVENLVAWLPVFGTLGRVCLDEPHGVKRSISDTPSALFNSIMDARLEPEEVEDAITAVLSEAKQKNVPVLWWIGPGTRPADLAEHLQKQGFVPDDEAPGMSVELESLKEKAPPEGMTIEVCQSEADLLLFSEVMTEGFGGDPVKEHRGVETWQKVLRKADPEQVTAYIGRLNEKAVATSVCILGGGVAGIYAVATVPEARGRGIGRYMTQYPLCEARNKGYKAGILQASEMGYKVYQSMGFEENCRFSMYQWKPQA